MSMDSQDKWKKQYPFSNSFRFAFLGILTAIKTEKNMKFHLLSSMLVLLLSFYFSISKIEWIFILFSIGGMISLEMINSAIERVVDLVTSEFHPLAKQAKDIAAGAVLIYALLSGVTGLVIFVPYILILFK